MDTWEYDNLKADYDAAVNNAKFNLQAYHNKHDAWYKLMADVWIEAADTYLARLQDERPTT